MERNLRSAGRGLRSESGRPNPVGRTAECQYRQAAVTFILRLPGSGHLNLTKRLTALALATTAVSCKSAPAPGTDPADSSAPTPSALVGTWRLSTVEISDSMGSVVERTRPVGMIIYTGDGHMAVQVMVLPRPVVPPVPEGPDQVSAWNDEQLRRVVETYDAYFGTYVVDSAQHLVTHHVEGELRPNHVGAAYARRYALSGDTLSLSSTKPGEYWRVIWERVK